MDKPWKTLRVSHRLPTGRQLPTSSTALKLQSFKSGKVKTISPASALAYSTPVAVQATVTTAWHLTYCAPKTLCLAEKAQSNGMCLSVKGSPTGSKGVIAFG
jgi:hypothetical protein